MNQLCNILTELYNNRFNDFFKMTNVYSKPATPKLSLLFTHFALVFAKSGLITCFLNRAFIVCNIWLTCHEEISKQKNIFDMNGYPKEIFDSHVRKCLSEELMTTNSC